MATPTTAPKESLCPSCGKQAQRKTYVGGKGHYFFCPSPCWNTFGGEETAAKKALIQAACNANVLEGDEVEGRVLRPAPAVRMRLT